MSEVIAQVSRKLVEHLGSLRPKITATLADPTVGGTSDDVSVWLYKVTPDEFSRNTPPLNLEKASGTKVRLKRPPLGMNLYFLVTPLSSDPEQAIQDLENVVQAFYVKPQFDIDEPTFGIRDTISITLLPDHQDARVQLWDSLKEKYRLGVCYVVRTVRLYSFDPESQTPVVVVKGGHEELPRRPE